MREFDVAWASLGKFLEVVIFIHKMCGGVTCSALWQGRRRRGPCCVSRGICLKRELARLVPPRCTGVALDSARGFHRHSPNVGVRWGHSHTPDAGVRGCAAAPCFGSEGQRLADPFGLHVADGSSCVAFSYVQCVAFKVTTGARPTIGGRAGGLTSPKASNRKETMAGWEPNYTKAFWWATGRAFLLPLHRLLIGFRAGQQPMDRAPGAILVSPSGGGATAGARRFSRSHSGVRRNAAGGIVAALRARGCPAVLVAAWLRDR